MASVGQIFLRSQKQEGSDKSKVMNIEHAKGNSSAPPQPASKNGQGGQKKNGNKKKKGKGNGDVFRVQGNNINGGKADKCGVFGFGNKYYGSKKPKEDESSEEETDSNDEDEE